MWKLEQAPITVVDDVVIHISALAQPEHSPVRCHAILLQNLSVNVPRRRCHKAFGDGKAICHNLMHIIINILATAANKSYIFPLAGEGLILLKRR